MAVWIAVASGFFLFFLLYLLVITRLEPKTQIKERVQKLRPPISAADQVRIDNENLNASFHERIILPVFYQLEQQVIRLTPGEIYKLLAERIMRAGKQYVWSVNAFICFWLLSAISLIGIALFFSFYIGQMIFIQGFALMVAALLLSGILPIVFLDLLIVKRQKKILRQLPEMLDLLCVSVQAGLAFDGAMARVAARMKGPLIDECSKMLRDFRMGMPRKIALTNMAERCRISEIHLFTAAIIQADRLGVSMAKTLLIQSENMRERRRQTVKEQALEAPVKMLLPLAIFIFPALFVVILFPTVFSILNNLKALGR